MSEQEYITDLGHWEYDGDVPSDTYGFIYEIVNLVTDRKYVGKKQMTSIRKMQPLKGKKNKRHKIVETDWKSYTSSSADLNADIDTIGKDNFKFNIIRLCNSKWELSYFEAKYQFEHDVLLTENYYNGIINLRVGKAPKSYKGE